MTEDPVFKRVLIKLSGEALMGPLDYGTDGDTVRAIAQQLKGVAKAAASAAGAVAEQVGNSDQDDNENENETEKEDSK